MANPRIDDLRKRLEKEPGSRVFAQLAEELRKEGEFEEAIQVCREGLQKHANYPSARLTLGRALFESGDLAAARKEFELVVKGAPDNIIASRMLGESLERLGELEAARERYKKTLAMAPGEKHVAAQLAVLERAIQAKAAPAPAPAPVLEEPEPVAPPVAAVPVKEPPPIKLVEVNEPMELEKPYEPPTAAPTQPIKLVEVNEPMELEKPYETPTVAPASAPSAVLSPPPPLAPSAPVEEVVEFEEARTLVESPREERVVEVEEEAIPATLPLGMHAPTFSEPPSAAVPAPPPPAPPQPEIVPAPPATVFTSATPAAAPQPAVAPPPEPEPEPEIEPEPEVEAEPDAEPVPEPKPEPPPAVAAPPPAPPIPAPPPAPSPVAATPAPPSPPPVAAPEPPPAPPAPEAPPAPSTPPITDEIASVTLAELYFNQGFTDKAIEVLKQLLQREPGNERARTRLAEIQDRESRVMAEQAQASTAPASDADGRAQRRQAIERTIAQLEKMLAAIRKG